MRLIRKGKFKGFKSLPANVSEIHFVCACYLNKSLFSFYYDDTRFYLSKKQFIEFHNEIEENHIYYTDDIYYFNDKI